LLQPRAPVLHGRSSFDIAHREVEIGLLERRPPIVRMQSCERRRSRAASSSAAARCRPAGDHAVRQPHLQASCAFTGRPVDQVERPREADHPRQPDRAAVDQ